MVSLFVDCTEYCICGCETAEKDLHCMYCTEPVSRHHNAAVADFLATWPDDEDKRRVRAALGMAGT